MALCACARIGLWVMVLVAVLPLPRHVAGEPGFHDESSSIRSSPEDAVSVRTVALDVETAHQQEKAESTIAADQASTSTADGQEMESTSAADQEVEETADSWRETSSDVHIRVGKTVAVQRRRGLRTSTPYPCSLPAGACGLQTTCCGRICADVLTNRNHCGRCGHLCRPSRACCNGKCRRLNTDERNCGRCGAWCAPGTRCLFGLCGY